MTKIYIEIKDKIPAILKIKNLNGNFCSIFGARFHSDKDTFLDLAKTQRDGQLVLQLECSKQSFEDRGTIIER